MKNKKINLEDLKVKSFITDLKGENLHTAKGGGGGGPLHSLACPTGVWGGTAGSCVRVCLVP